MRTWIRLAVVLLPLVSAGCQTKVDLTKGIEVVDVSTGWTKAESTDGQNKVVAAVSFRFKNTSDQTLSTLQANVLFRRAGDDSEWGSSFVRVTGTDGLPPGATSPPQRVSSPKGYTGSDPHDQLLQNSQFVDARVKVFAKYASTQWQPVGEFPVDRRMMGN